MLRAVALAALAASAAATTYFEERFQDDDWKGRWVESQWKSEMGKWEHTKGDWYAGVESMGLQTGSEFRHHAISARLPAAFSSVGKTLVVQFTVKHEKREYSFCGGGYIKLLSASSDQEKFGGDTPYHIMFGPDFCGYDVSRIHVIFNQDGENLLKKDEVKVEYADKNEFTHLYTLVVKPDGTYKVLFDESEKASGKLLDGWAFQQPEFDDPKDHKPSDWVDEAKVADPEDTKPEGWDEIPKQIADPEASKPDDWDEDSDGEWEAPMIDNPKYKGEWKARMIDNPQYKGEWKAKQITNPKYKADVGQYADIGAVGFELWTVNHGSIFDNILVTDDEEAAKKHAKKYFDGLKEKEKTAKEAFDKVKKDKEEAEKKKDEKKEDAKEDDEDDEEL